MSSGANGSLDVKCNKCGHTIPFATTHAAMLISMANGTASHQRYCADCCADPQLAVLMSDVIQQPIAFIRIKKVWG